MQPEGYFDAPEPVAAQGAHLQERLESAAALAKRHFGAFEQRTPVRVIEDEQLLERVPVLVNTGSQILMNPNYLRSLLENQAKLRDILVYELSRVTTGLLEQGREPSQAQAPSATLVVPAGELAERIVDIDVEATLNLDGESDRGREGDEGDYPSLAAAQFAIGFGDDDLPGEPTPVPLPPSMDPERMAAD